MTVHQRTARGRRLALVGLGSLALLAVCSSPLLHAQADKDKSKGKAKDSPAVAMDVVSAAEWAKASTAALTAPSWTS